MMRAACAVATIGALLFAQTSEAAERHLQAAQGAAQPWSPLSSDWAQQQIAKQNSLTTPLPGALSAFGGSFTVGMSSEAADLVGGTIDSFLGGQQVSDTERQCISNGASQMASELTDTAGRALESFKQLSLQTKDIHVTTTLPGLLPGTVAAPASAPNPSAPINPFAHVAAAPDTATQAPPVSKEMAEGEAAVIAMELASKMSHLYKMQSGIAKSCLNADVLQQMDLATDHMTNMTFIGSRLLANGYDIVTELADGFSKFENKDFRGFGSDIGLAWRNVVLSKQHTAGMPEPTPQAIELCTTGLFQSFFGPGFNMQVATDAVPAAPASAAAIPGAVAAAATPTAEPPMVMNVDLHNCIGGNMPLLTTAWMPAIQLAESAEDPTVKPPNMEQMMFAMMDVQLALTRCNISPEQEAMLVDAAQSGSLHTKLAIPQATLDEGGVSELLASALTDYKTGNWYAFGTQLGKAMQSMMVEAFPEEYEVDSTGKLRKQIMAASELSRMGVMQTRSSAALVAFVLLGVSSLLLTALILRVRRRSQYSLPSNEECQYDVEAIE
jgi:hypothetical protein